MEAGVLEELGSVSKELRDCIQNLDDDTLVHWTMLASRVESMEGFLEQIKES